MSSLPKVRKMVEYCLKTYPETRDSDITLTIKIWEEYFPQRLIVGTSGAKAIRLTDLFDLPREDHIKRIRAMIQNDPISPRFLPTSLAVAKQRGIEEQVWREYITNETAYRRI